MGRRAADGPPWVCLLFLLPGAAERNRQGSGTSAHRAPSVAARHNEVGSSEETVGQVDGVAARRLSLVETGWAWVEPVLNLCSRRHMTDRTIYAQQDEVEERRHRGQKRDGTGNQRNGSTGKTVLAGEGPLRSDIPRNRGGRFDRILIRKHERCSSRARRSPGRSATPAPPTSPSPAGCAHAPRAFVPRAVGQLRTAG